MDGMFFWNGVVNIGFVLNYGGGWLKPDVNVELGLASCCGGWLKLVFWIAPKMNLVLSRGMFVFYKVEILFTYGLENAGSVLHILLGEFWCVEFWVVVVMLVCCALVWDVEANGLVCFPKVGVSGMLIVDVRCEVWPGGKPVFNCSYNVLGVDGGWLIVPCPWDTILGASPVIMEISKSVGS